MARVVAMAGISKCSEKSAAHPKIDPDGPFVFCGIGFSLSGLDSGSTKKAHGLKPALPGFTSRIARARTWASGDSACAQIVSAERPPSRARWAQVKPPAQFAACGPGSRISFQEQFARGTKAPACGRATL